MGMLVLLCSLGCSLGIADMMNARYAAQVWWQYKAVTLILTLHPVYGVQCRADPVA